MPLTCLRWNDTPSAAMLSRFCIFFLRIKTRTGLVAECVVTNDDGVRILLLQLCQQVKHCLFLFRCTGVCWLAFGIEASFVANTDGVSIVVQTMRTNHLLRLLRHVHAGRRVKLTFFETFITTRSNFSNDQILCPKTCHELLKMSTLCNIAVLYMNSRPIGKN